MPAHANLPRAPSTRLDGIVAKGAGLQIGLGQTGEEILVDIGQHLGVQTCAFVHCVDLYSSCSSVAMCASANR